MSDSDRPHSRGEEPQASPRASFSVAGHIGSVNTSSSVSPSTSSSSSGSTKTAVSECLSSWLNYLQILNSLCSAGFKLSQSLSTLAHCSPDHSANQTPLGGVGGPPLLLPMLSGWDDLGRATAVATSTVKCHIVTALQEFVTHAPEGEVERARENNYQIIADNISTLINLQYQFCIACFDCLSCAGPCPSCHSQPGHDQECNVSMMQQYFSRMCSGAFLDTHSQTPSPHSGTGGALTLSQGSLDSPKSVGGLSGAQSFDKDRIPPLHPSEKSFEYYRHFNPGEPGAAMGEVSRGYHSEGPRGSHHEGGPLYRGPSPVEHLRGPSPIQGFLDTIRGPSHIEYMRGPLPNPGQLLGMKGPFHGGPRGLRSPLHFPLFPLNGQRRWSEAAAAEVGGGGESGDPDGTMRRWSMPWDCVKGGEHHGWGAAPHRGPVAPSKLAVPPSRSGSDRSRSTTPDSIWQPSIASQDGLAEAIQLLSCRPGMRPQPHPQMVNPQQQMHETAMHHHHWLSGDASGSAGPSYLYSMWSGSERPCLPFIRLPEMPEQQRSPAMSQQQQGAQNQNPNAPNTGPANITKPP